MTIDERLRLNIHNKLTELLGSEEADALIAHIMPVPWYDVATKDDLQLLRADLQISRAETRAELHKLIVAQTRWLVGFVTAYGVLLLAVARFLF